MLALCYLLTLGMIYVCVPLAQSDSNMGVDHQYFAQNVTAFTDSQNKYKLHWREKEKVYFKKVREIVQQKDNVNNAADEDNIKCDRKSTTIFHKINAGFYIYSAYFDKRNGTRFIRIIAAVSRGTIKEDLDSSFHCLFDMEEAGNMSNTAHAPMQFYEMCENHKKRFGGWIVSCKIPSAIDSTPSKIRVEFRKSNHTVAYRSNDICVSSRDKNVVRRKLNYGVCVPPIYGDVKAKALIEFIEFNRILGADVFILYLETSLESLSPEVRSIVRYYQRQNVVIPIPWHLPFTTSSIWYHGQSLVINDCLYRNMNDFKYLAFVDLDEFIIPQGDLLTWNDVIGELNKTSPVLFKGVIGLTFKSTFYSDEFSRHVFSNEMTMTVRTNRTKHFSYRRNKVIVRPEKIFELGIHHVSKPLIESYSNIINVPTTTAHIHHYRPCLQEFGIHCNVRIEDYTIPKKYGQRIIDNYLKTMFDITP